MSLLSQLCTEKLLKKCAQSVKSSKPTHKRKSSKGIDGISLETYFAKENESVNISRLQKTLQNNTFNFNKLKGIPIPKEESEKDRLITAPTVQDRIVHKAILAVINPLLYEHINTGASYCGVKKEIFKKTKNGFNTKEAIKKVTEHLRKKEFWVLKADIEKFFDRVPKNKLLTKLNTFLSPDDSLSSMLHSIVYFQLGNIAVLENNRRIQLPEAEIGVSQGSSLSPLFANVYLEDFDRAIQKKFGDVLIRYVDDLLVFSDSEKKIRDIKKFIDDYLLKKGLNVSEKKTYIRNLLQENIEFLGLKLDRHSIREKNNIKIFDKLITEIFDLNHKEYRHLEKHEEKIERMNQKIQGIFNYYRYYHVEKLVNKINTIIDRQIQKHEAYRRVQFLDLTKIAHVISLEDWQNLFKKRVI